MAHINVSLQFPHEINVSVQVGDIVYYVDTDPVGVNRDWESTTTPHWTADRTDILMIGPIINIIPPDPTLVVNALNPATIIANMPHDLAAQYGPPDTNDFIMFSKDNKVNLGSLLGYYSLVKLRNDSTEKGEIFSIATDFIESSK